MIAGGHALLNVADMSRAVRFYVETMGFKLVRRASDDAWAEIDAGRGLILGLMKARPDAVKPGTRGSIVIGLDVEGSFEDQVKILENRGVVFEGPVQDRADVKIARFRDVDGNALYLSQPVPRPLGSGAADPAR